MSTRNTYALGWSDGQTRLMLVMRERLAGLAAAPALHAAILAEIRDAWNRAGIAGAIQCGDLSTEYIDAQCGPTAPEEG